MLLTATALSYRSYCTYPGVEALPEGTLIDTTHGHWNEGEEPYIVCLRLNLSELDELANSQPK
jgi:hypothetical protein